MFELNAVPRVEYECIALYGSHNFRVHPSTTDLHAEMQLKIARLYSLVLQLHTYRSPERFVSFQSPYILCYRKARLQVPWLQPAVLYAGLVVNTAGRTFFLSLSHSIKLAAWEDTNTSTSELLDSIESTIILAITKASRTLPKTIC